MLMLNQDCCQSCSALWSWVLCPSCHKALQSSGSLKIFPVHSLRSQAQPVPGTWSWAYFLWFKPGEMQLLESQLLVYTCMRNRSLHALNSRPGASHAWNRKWQGMITASDRMTDASRIDGIKAQETANKSTFICWQKLLTLLLGRGEMATCSPGSLKHHLGTVRRDTDGVWSVVLDKYQ